MTTARGPALTTTMRVIDRVHDDAANGRTLAQVAVTARFTQVDVLLIRVRDSADRRHALGTDDTQLTGRELQLSVALVTTDQLGVGPSGTGDLTAFARLHLDIVDDRTDRHVRHRHCIARLHVDLVAGFDLVTRL